jgi:hypothetical protein
MTAINWNLRIASHQMMGNSLKGPCQFEPSCRSKPVARVKLGEGLDEKTWITKDLCEHHRYLVVMKRAGGAKVSHTEDGR